MNYSYFHATLADLTPRLQQIESRFRLKYIPIGEQKNEGGDIYTSVFDIPDLGIAKSDSFHPDYGFLVCPAESEFVVEAVAQQEGGIKYWVETDSNPGAFEFCPGGMSGSALDGGWIWLDWSNTTDPAVRKLCFIFSQMLLEGFESELDANKFPWWVGPEAMQLLRSGRRLHTVGGVPLARPVELNGLLVRIQEGWNHDAKQVLRAAFGRSNEADLVEALHKKGNIVSLVAEIEGRVVGYIGFSPVEIKGPERSFTAQGLGPLAVLPEFQRMGIGSALVRSGLDSIFWYGENVVRYTVVVVLGDPKFYGRFGFERSTKYGIRWEHEVPEQYFQVIGRYPDSLNGVSGVVSYLPEFENV